MKTLKNKKSRRIPVPLRVALSLLGITSVVIAAFNVSPFAGSMLIRKLFDYAPKEPPESLNFGDSVTASPDISYGNSKYETLDLYTPAGGTGCPLIVWVHGGAFVGGDKRDVTYFAKALAANGYAVAVINYTRAPESKYPTPVLQLGRVYEFLTNGDYKGSDKIDAERIFIAGDSAGAHIASQFALLQTNAGYRDNFIKKHAITDFPEPIPPQRLRGALLFCGPYSVDKLANPSNPLLRFMLGQASWAYFGSRDLADSPFAAEIDIIGSVTAGFPPSFITDGNTMSFPDHALELSAALTALGVPVRELLFDGSPDDVPHEFQFDLQTSAAQHALNETLNFLEEYSAD